MPHPHRHRRDLRSPRWFAITLLATLACSSSKNAPVGPGQDGGGGGGGGVAPPGSDAGSAGAAGDANFGFSRADGPPGGGGAGGSGGVPGTMGAYPCLDNQGGACAGTLYKAKGLPTDIFVMFDQSGSMAKKDDGVTMRMDAVRNAVDQFMAAPESNGLGVGIGYFGSQPLTCACTSCNPADYATPAVAVGALPAQAAAINASLKGIMPTGETPTGAAIRGACTYTKGLKSADPMRNVIILLVTDGEPEAPLTSQKGTCNPTLDDAVAAATECSAAGVPTYVLGVGPSLDNLNKIAAAGRTKSAYLVASGGTAEIVKALGNIRSDAAIPCALEVPAVNVGSTVDFGKVNVVYADASCKVSTFLYVDTPASCNAQTGGWYYDDPKNPKKISLCGPTCEQVKAAGGQLVVSVGCMTKVIP
jgi:hypothetical protein